MAHFAKIGLNNVVISVVVVADRATSTRGGIEKEDLGIDFLERSTGHANWVKCSYNTHEGVHDKGGTPFRVTYPGPGYIYDSTNDMFHPPRPIDADGDECASWTRDKSTAVWNPPITKPQISEEQEKDLKYYAWDESLYQSDNSQGWIIRTLT